MKSYDTAKEDQKKKLDFLKRGMQLNYQHHWYVWHLTSYDLKFQFPSEAVLWVLFPFGEMYVVIV